MLNPSVEQTADNARDASVRTHFRPFPLYWQSWEAGTADQIEFPAIYFPRKVKRSWSFRDQIYLAKVVLSSLDLETQKQFLCALQLSDIFAAAKVTRLKK